MIFAEAVTLAHVARPIALSRILRQLGHDVSIAVSPAAARWVEPEGIAHVAISSIEPGRFQRALARGFPPYDSNTLVGYVEDDLRAMAEWGPDIVIGDFRLSLYMSSQVAGKPYGAIVNAYWSRRYWREGSVPPIGALNWLPQRAAGRLFTAIRPIAFAVHALPFERACRRFGIRSPGLDLRHVYTASDVTAFADVESAYGNADTETSDEHFLGPLGWSPPAPPIPPLPGGLPIVFVSLGSSGSPRVLPVVLDALAALPVRCVVATGAHPRVATLPANCVFAADLISYDEACRVASVVVCNGGAPAVYAATAHGVPAIGIASNFDQVLNLAAMRRRHESVTAIDVRSLHADAIRRAIESALDHSTSDPRAPAPDKRLPASVDRARAWIDALAASTVEQVYKRRANERRRSGGRRPNS